MGPKKCLALVYSDVCRSFEVPSSGGNKYFITFVDKYYRMILLYMIKMKSEAFEVFLRFKANVERDSGNLLETLKTNVGENSPLMHLKITIKLMGLCMKSQHPTPYTL